MKKFVCPKKRGPLSNVCLWVPLKTVMEALCEGKIIFNCFNYDFNAFKSKKFIFERQISDIHFTVHGLNNSF